MAKKNSGPVSWESDDEKYPRRFTHCTTCGRYGEMKLAYDQHSYLCIHAGKCIARAARKRLGEEGQEENE